jgi:hypothetical protein
MNKQKEGLETIVDVKPVEECPTEIIDKNRLKDLIEKPLLKACEELYDKNVKTIDSGASGKDFRKEGNSIAYIRIDYDTLSDENKKIAQKVCDIEKSMVIIRIPFYRDTTVQEVERKSLEIAAKFKPQPLLWGGYKKEEIEKLAKKAKEYSGEAGVKFFEKIKENFLPETGLSYRSKELYEKAKNYAKSKK